MGLAIAPAASTINLSDAKSFLNKTSTTDDAELQATLDSAQAILVQRVGPLTPVTFTETYPAGNVILLRQWPVVSVTSVTYADGTPITLSNLDVDVTTGAIYAAYGSSQPFPAAYGPRGMTVTYIAGRAVVPPDLRQAVLELTGHLWDSQRGGPTAGRPRFDGSDPQPTASYLLPYRIESLISPYQIPMIA